MKFLTSRWLTPPLGLLAYTLATVLFWKTPALPPPPVKNGAVNTRAAIPSWDFVNPEADQMMEELRAEKRALAARQKQLDDTAKNIEAERAEVAKVKQGVSKMQKDFDQIVLRVQDEEVSNLKRLAKVYAAMTPDTAANVFTNLDDSAIVKIMMFMKEGETAAVIESFAKKGDAEAKRAAAISERLRLSSHSSPPIK